MLAQPLARRLARPLARRIVRSGDFSPAAQDYFARVSSAGGTVTHPGPVAAYIDALVALGGAYWNTMGTHCIFAGVTFPGCFVPLRSGMGVPTNFNFVSGDHNSVTGLIGNGSTKYIDSGRNNNADGQNDQSMSVFLSNAVTNTGVAEVFIGTGAVSVSGTTRMARVSTAENLVLRNRNSTIDTLTAGPAITAGFVGMSRNNSANFVARQPGTTQTIARTSQAALAGNVFVFASNNAGAIEFCSERMKAYHIGPSLDLAVLAPLQITLFAAIT
jgi:hypothetical protein